MKQDERHHTLDDFFVGIDLATRQHQVVILDAQAAVSRASRFHIPGRVSTSLWSAAPLRVSAGDEERCTSRSRRPGTCGRRSVPSLSSTHFGITWSIPLATFRVREARQMGRDKRDLTDAEQIAQLLTGIR